MPACRSDGCWEAVIIHHRKQSLLFCKANTAESQMLRACSSPSREPSITDQPAVQTRVWRFFPLYGCGKNTTAWLVAWTGHAWPVTILQAMGGRIVCFCSDPIPPVAVPTDQPAKHVLSRSAGGKASSGTILRIFYRILLHLPN